MKTTVNHKKIRKKGFRVLIVDDHPIVRQGITQLINREDDLMVCGHAEDAQEALKAIESSKPNIVVMDLSLKESSGISLIKDIKVRDPQLPVLVLSMHDESLYAERALRAGAQGYVIKAEATEQIVKAIRRVLSGEIHVSEGIAGKILRSAVGGRSESAVSSLEQLTDRELEIFRMIGEGLETRAIAKQLYLSVKTVQTHREHIKEKLNLKNSTQLVQHATLWVQSEQSSR